MTDPGQSMRSVTPDEAADRVGDPPKSLWRRLSVRVGVVAIVVSVVMNFPALRSVLEELWFELSTLVVLAIGVGMARRVGDLPKSLWGRIGVWTGVVAIVVSLIMGSPTLGGGALGELRFVLATLGLLAIGAGVAALLRHRTWHAAGKAAAVASTVVAIGALVFFGVDQVPIWPQSCATAGVPTAENPGPVYCHEGDGTLVRMSISNVRQCPDGSIIWDNITSRRWQSGWYTELPGRGCPL